MGNSTGPIKFYNNLVIANALLNTPSYPTFAATEKERGIWLEPRGRRMGSSISSIQTRNQWG